MEGPNSTPRAFSTAGTPSSDVLAAAHGSVKGVGPSVEVGAGYTGIWAQSLISATSTLEDWALAGGPGCVFGGFPRYRSPTDNGFPCHGEFRWWFRNGLFIGLFRPRCKLVFCFLYEGCGVLLFFFPCLREPEHINMVSFGSN